MKQISVPAFLILLSTMVFAAPGFATEQKSTSGHHDEKHHSKMEKKKGHHFSPHWAKTLSDDQKMAIDRMHLDLNRELSVLKAQAELAQKELNAYTIRDNAKTSTINTMITKLLAVKKQIMEKRYAHLREMRNALTTEQRISYDMGVLKRSGAK